MNSGGLFAKRNLQALPFSGLDDGFDLCVYESAARQLHRDVLADFEVAHANLPGRLRGFYHALPDSTFLSVKSQECRASDSKKWIGSMCFSCLQCFRSGSWLVFYISTSQQD